MRKILLIEDVATRQKNFMKEQDFKLEEYTGVLDNTIGDNYVKIEKSVKDENFDFSEYAVIMVHGSAFGKDRVHSLETLKQYCEKTEIPFVLFSGGDSNYYNNTKYEYLELNSKDFYSHNLKVFLDAYKQNEHNILMLSYGEKWMLNTLLSVLENTNIYLQENSQEDILYEDYQIFTKIVTLGQIQQDIIDFSIEDDWVCRKNIISLRDSILKYIEKINNV